ncbi:MAG: phosphate acetyltransferase [Gammaproteobacteria bacterium]
MTFISHAISQAKSLCLPVVFPEAQDERILQAARQMADTGIARPVLLGEQAAVASVAAACSVRLDDLPVLDPAQNDNLERYAQLCAQGPRQMALKLTRRLVRKPLYFGALMVQAGDAAAMVAGAAHPTARVIEAGLIGVGLAEGIGTPSSFFLMLLPQFQGQSDYPLIFADCAVNIDPDPAQLADIALASAASAAKLLGTPARVAFLSFSTQGSAQHAAVDKVSQALQIARERAPELLLDGEFQADTALAARVAAKKLKTPSTVAGQANVLIFPDLNAGNIGYKLTQQLAGAQAIGPILQGFARPVCDLSRGASVDDIIAATAVALALR